MKKTTVTVSFDEEKLGATRHYLSLKNLSLDAELNRFLDTLFKKYVPAEVRGYLEFRDAAKPMPVKRPTKTKEEQSNG